MHIVLFDGNAHQTLLPLTATRPVSEIRIGILKLSEKWEKYFSNASVSHLCPHYLQNRFPLDVKDMQLVANAAVCINKVLAHEISDLKANEALFSGEHLLAYWADADSLKSVNNEAFTPNTNKLKHLESKANAIVLQRPWDIFKNNAQALDEDFELITNGRTSATISTTNTLLGERVFAEESAVIECAILNSKTGPIYIGHEAEIMEGSVVRGGLAMLEHACIKLSGKMYGATTLGPHVKVGGEINNSVIFGFSNKGHDGFLGNAVLGEWCNLGADTNNSNLKNNYSEVSAYAPAEKKLIATGLQFCGLIMGDHSKSGINTMFNTGTVCGVSANVFGAGFPPKYIADFSWGGAEGFEDFKLEKALEVAEKMMERRGISLSKEEREILTYLHGQKQ